MDLVLNELQDTKTQLTEVSKHLIEVQTTLKIFVEQNIETKKSLEALDLDFKKRFEPLAEKVSSWSGALKIISIGSMLVPILIMGVFAMFNPNNVKLEDLDKRFQQHVYDPKLHHNIISYIDSKFVTKQELRDHCNKWVGGIT